MTKTIKFNLMMNGTPVRSLEALKDQFNVHDILEYHHNGLLRKWLIDRGLMALAERLPGDSVPIPEAIRQLARLLDLQVAPAEYDYALSALSLDQQRKDSLAFLQQAEFDRGKVLAAYHKGYEDLLTNLQECGSDFPAVKAGVRELQQQYFGLFWLDYRSLYFRFIEAAPLVVFGILMHKTLRNLFLTHDEVNNHLAGIFRNDLLLARMEPHVKSFNGKTESYWRVVQPSGKEYLIIRMENSNYVRDQGQHDVQLSAAEVNGKYLLLNGIDYMSNSDSQKLLYMEV